MARTELPSSVEELQALVLQQQEELSLRDAAIAERDATIVESVATILEKVAALEARDAKIEANRLTIDEQARLIEFFREWKRLIDSQRFAARSEKYPPEQARLFNEAELEVADEESEAIEVPAHSRGKRRGRRPLPDFLPVEERIHDLPESEKVCTNDASHTLAEIGRESSDQLKFIPARIEIVRHIRPKYACPQCKAGVAIAPMPKLPIPKSLATPSLLAHVATSKYVDALPLYRQEKIFHRLGLDLSRATLASWMIKVGELVEPLMERLRAEVRNGDIIQCDETPFQVLKEPGKRAQSQSYLWALRGGSRDHPLLFYEYDPSRSAEVPKRLLAGFRGYLQTDGYEGYTAIGREPGIVHAGCWAHTRRKFDEALRGQPRTKKKGKKQPAKQSKARQGLAQIQALYRIEKGLRDATVEERTRVREERSKPIVEGLRTWLNASLGTVPEKSLTGKALHYLATQWPKLVRVFDDGRIPLDTNLVENAIRPFVIGRRNWLFADTPAGARASANLYSLIETAKANRIEPARYLAHLFATLPDVTSTDQLDALLPQSLDLDALTLD